MKKIWVHSLFILLFGCSVNASAGTSRTIIAVWDFDNTSFMDIAAWDYLTKALPEILMTQLVSSPSLEVVERLHLREIMEEQKLGSSDLADQDTKIRLAKIMGARFMIFGAFMVIGEDSRVDVRLVDTATSEVLLAEKFDGNIGEMIPGMQTITTQFVAYLGAKPAEDAKAGVDVAQWKEYEKGLALIDEKQYEAALGVFQGVLEKDPGFYAAEKQVRLILDLMSRQ